MSMICCEICAASVDTDFHVEVCRYGYRVESNHHKQHIAYTGNENDTCFICDNCFGDREDHFDIVAEHQRPIRSEEEFEAFMERCKEQDRLDDALIDDEAGEET